MQASCSQDIDKEVIANNINAISVNVVSEIEKQLPPYDLRSMVFLLYDGHDTALQRLTLYQRVSNGFNLLYDWAIYMQSNTNWKYMFLEALAISQLYSIVRKLGFNVDAVKKYFKPNDIHNHKKFYVNATKKALYKLCEEVTHESLGKIKRSLISYDMNVAEYETCEMVLLELLSQKFITLDDISKLVAIIDNIAPLHNIALKLKLTETSTNVDSKSSPKTFQLNSTPKPGKDLYYTTNFDDVFDALSGLAKLNIESDKVRVATDAYAIQNRNRVGVVYIINQENFHPSKHSIHTSSRPLEDRKGSTKDKVFLERVMTDLNFKVVTDDNLNVSEMFSNIKKVIKKEVEMEDSMFVLCILSHGIRGKVYAADSVAVKVEEIQEFLHDVGKNKLAGKPKIMVIQACQVDSNPEVMFVSDGPEKVLRKSDFLVYWATAPQFEAFRNPKQGSIFIQALCYILKKCGRVEHLHDIFTKVNDLVMTICTEINIEQLPIFESTLRRKLYLHMPVKVNTV